MLFFDERIIVQPIMMRWIDAQGRHQASMMFADIRVTGQEMDGVPILEVDIGQHPEDQADQEARQDPPQRVDAPQEEDQVCRYCMVPEAGMDLIAPCECRGSLERCHVECLQKWYQQKRSLTCELCRQPYHMFVRAELVEEATRRDQEALRRQQEEDQQEQEDQEDWLEEEDQPRGVRRPRELMESDEEEPPARRRRTDEQHPTIVIEGEGDDEEEEIDNGIFGEDFDVGEERDPTYRPW